MMWAPMVGLIQRPLDTEGLERERERERERETHTFERKRKMSNGGLIGLGLKD